MKRFLLIIAILGVTLSAAAQRLPREAVPDHYQITLAPNLDQEDFTGEETIDVHVLKPTTTITLNAVDLEFGDVTIRSSAGTPQRAKVVAQPENEMVELVVAKPLPAGAAAIHIKFSGKLNQQLRGLYLGHENHRKYAATQFEATDARRAFPSFDEPSYKATFDITAIADKGDVAISNGKVISDTRGPEAGKHTVKFASSPKMSSYLVALIVGDFKYVEGEQDGIPIRVWATPGKEQQGKFALEAAEHILSFYDHYFSIKYPYSKLDLIALPDFSAGAMENTACITYREVALLMDDQHAPVQAQQGVASVIAHEMAHQWFGDLVTMAWWDDIWLNEGFATWMSNKPLEAWEPEWHSRLFDVRESGQALNVDSLQATRPIHQAADTPAQIQELFDGIAYAKTASVLRMLEAYVGTDPFRAGINAYLHKHAYANASAADFWTAVAQATHKPVDRIMPTFVNQPGTPLVTAQSRCVGNETKVTITQRRYFYDGALLERGTNQLWQIPVCLKQARTGNAEGAEKCQVLTTREQTVTLPGCSTWVFANAGGHGYYRSGYSAQAVRAMGRDVEQDFSPAERVVLLRDEWAAVRAANQQIGDFLALADGFKGDRSFAVMHELGQELQYIADRLVSSSDQQEYRDWVRRLVGPAAQELGWKASPSDSDERRQLRADVLNTLGYVGRDPDVLAQARSLARQALEDPSAVDPTLANTVFRLAAVEGDAALYDMIKAHLKSATSPQQYYRYHNALAEFSDPALLRRTLEMALTPEVRSQDALHVIGAVMRNPAGSTLAWDFVTSHWPQIQKIGGPFGAGAIAYSTASFCNAADRTSVKNFFTEHPIASAERTLRQSMETISYCADMKSQQSNKLAAWLQQHGAAASGK